MDTWIEKLNAIEHRKGRHERASQAAVKLILNEEWEASADDKDMMMRFNLKDDARFLIFTRAYRFLETIRSIMSADERNPSPSGSTKRYYRDYKLDVEESSGEVRLIVTKELLDAYRRLVEKLPDSGLDSALQMKSNTKAAA